MQALEQAGLLVVTVQGEKRRNAAQIGFLTR